MSYIGGLVVCGGSGGRNIKCEINPKPPGIVVSLGFRVRG